MQHRNRQELLKVLEMVSPGLGKQGGDQTNCFVFKGGAVHTLNGEVSCYHESGLGDVEGAVQASQLTSQLHKWTEDSVEIEVVDSVLWVYGNRRKAWFNMEAAVTLPVGDVVRPGPGDWIELPPRYGEAIDLVQGCAGKDLNKFQATCVHLHPEWVEATDDVQISRFTIRTGMARTLVRATSIRGMSSLGMTHYAQTKSMIHFKNAAGLVFSCLQYQEEFPDVGDALKVEGVKTIFPKSVQEAIDKAEIFSREKADDNVVQVSLMPGRMRIKGEGVSGGFSEVKDVLYDGKPMSFVIAPKMMAEIVRENNEVYVAEGKLVVDGGQFVYRTCTGAVVEE